MTVIVGAGNIVICVAGLDNALQGKLPTQTLYVPGSSALGTYAHDRVRVHLRRS